MSAWPSKAIRTILQAVGLFTIVGSVTTAIAIISAGQWLQVEDRLQHADYILPLAGDGERLLLAINLFKRGLAPKILIGKDYIKPPTQYQRLISNLGYPRIDPSEFKHRLLKYLDVPDDSIQTFGDNYISTIEEAEALRSMVGNRPLTIIIVTSAYHTRRAKIIFERVMPQATFLVTSPAEGHLPNRWWSTQESALTTVSELAKIAYYSLGGAFRKGDRLIYSGE